MKRGIGILVLTIISLALLYAPQSDTTTPLGLSCAKKPIPQQPTTQPTSGQPVSGFCFPPETQEIILATTPTQEVPIDYYYENIRTLGWRFNVDSEGALIKGPELKILSKTITLPLWAVEASGSDQNCKYYSFLYQRQVQTFNFDLPFTKTEFSDYDGDGKDERICYYSTEPIARDLLEITALSGQLNVDLNNPCPEIRGKPIESDQPCSQTEQCSIQVTRGEVQYFGFTFEKDACGNRLVKADNNGQPITSTELRNHADTFLSTCKQKYAVQSPQPQEPRQVCGNKIRENTEECDTSDFGPFADGTDKCKEYNPTYLTGNLACTSDCRIDDSECKGENIEARVSMEAYIKNVPGVDGDTPVGKIVATTTLINAPNARLPETLNYTLRIEGRAFTVRVVGGYKNIFAGIVDGAMFTLAKDLPLLFTIIKEADSKQQGVVGAGIVWEKDDSGPLILVKKIYHVSTAIFDLFKNNNYEGWFIYEIKTSLQRKQDGSSDITITSTIRRYNDNSFLLTPSQGAFTKKLSKGDTERLIIAILQRFDTYEDKPLNIAEVKPEWNAEPDVVRSVLPGATEGVTTLKRYKLIEKHLRIREKPGIAEIRRYLQTLLQKYNAQSSALPPTSEIEGLYFA